MEYSTARPRCKWNLAVRVAQRSFGLVTHHEVARAENLTSHHRGSAASPRSGAGCRSLDGGRSAWPKAWAGRVRPSEWRTRLPLPPRRTDATATGPRDRRWAFVRQGRMA